MWDALGHQQYEEMRLREFCFLFVTLDSSGRNVNQRAESPQTYSCTDASIFELLRELLARRHVECTTFEGMDELIGESQGPVRIGDVFPINKWTEAYHAHRYAIRLYAFSEYCNDVAIAGKKALAEVTKISDPDFYNRCRRNRG